MGTIRNLAMLGLAVAGLVACQPKNGRVDEKRLEAAVANGDWIAVGRTQDEQHFSPLDKINTGNVATLGLAWFADFDTDRGQEATPVIVDGVLYTTTSWSTVHAFDAKTGKELWAYDPKVDKAKGFDACCDVVNRGVAVWKGKVYVGTIDGRLVSLNADTGKVDWSVQTTDNSQPYTITGAPRIVKGKVLIGNGGAEYGVRGYITAYDAASGKKVWRFYTVPNAEGKADGEVSDKVLADKANGTWFGQGWKDAKGGGTVWDSMAYDPKLDILYVGVGNGSPWNHKVRSDGKGDNLFLSSILALKPDTGEYVWHFQTTPGESWDYTAVQPIMLADLPVGANGATERVVMQAPKNGFFYVLDAATGKFISAKNYASINWATGVDPATGRPIENPAARYVTSPNQSIPGPYGAHNWQPMAFNPKQGLVYIPVVNVPFTYGNDPNYRHVQGAWNLAIDQLLNSLPDGDAKRAAMKPFLSGDLVAWDPVTQSARWTVHHDQFWNGGVLATAGGLVFQGGADSKFNAYDAASGKPLWSADTGQGVIAAPATYQVDGDQYVALMVGSGGSGQLSSPYFIAEHTRLPGRLLVFKLGGAAIAPAYKELPPPAPLDLTNVSSTGDPKTGYETFEKTCNVCHGSKASGHFLPNLLRSQMILTTKDFDGVVIEGQRAPNGMASFKRFLTIDQVEDIRAYLLQEAALSGGATGGPKIAAK
jgi:quinohemoprotein ethanol dehydrogenase